MEKDYNLDIRDNVPNARGTIHPPAISRGFSLPLDPTDDYKREWVDYINYDHGGMYSLSVMEGLPSASGMNYSLCVKLA